MRCASHSVGSKSRTRDHPETDHAETDHAETDHVQKIPPNLGSFLNKRSFHEMIRAADIDVDLAVSYNAERSLLSRSHSCKRDTR